MADNKKTSIGGKSTCHLLNVKQPDRVAKRMKFSFQRTKAVVNILKSNRPVDSAMSLLDISESGLGVFTAELLLKGSSVELCITEPRILRVKAIVAWSIPIKSGIQTARFPFRSGLQFIYENETQRAAVLEFIQKVGMNPLDLPRPQEQTHGANGAPPAEAPSPANTPVAAVDPTAPAVAAPVAAEPAAASAELGPTAEVGPSAEAPATPGVEVTAPAAPAATPEAVAAPQAIVAPTATVAPEVTATPVATGASEAAPEAPTAPAAPEAPPATGEGAGEDKAA